MKTIITSLSVMIIVLLFHGMAWAPPQAPGSAPVTVVNPSTNAVPVKEVDAPGRQPYEIWVEFSKFGCENDNCNDFSSSVHNYMFYLPPVPEGKRWVIVKASGVIPTGEAGLRFILQSRRVVSWQALKWGFFGPFFLGYGGGVSGFSADVFTSYGPGETPHVNIFAPDASNTVCSITFSGYLIDEN